MLYTIAVVYFNKNPEEILFTSIFLIFADYPRIRLSAEAAPPNSADNREFTVFISNFGA